MDTDTPPDRSQHASIEVIVAAHAAFNDRRLDELEVLMGDDVDLFIPLALGLSPTAAKGTAALRATLERVLRLAPDLHLALDRAEDLGSLVILTCTATATGTDAQRYSWPLRVLVAEDQGRITRYIVRPPAQSDILADAHAFVTRTRRADGPA